MIQIDLQKAFDCVAHNILFSVLEHVNVGTVILEGVKMSYAQSSASVIVNKEVGESFDILSSVRRACPLSPLLFAIYLEPFCLKILHNENIHGFCLHYSEVKILSYADDIAVFCIDKKSVSEVVNDLKRFCELSASAVNWMKGIEFWRGNWQSRPVFLENMPWTTTPTRYLGIPLENYQDVREYWDGETDRVREKLTQWGERDLSMFPRASVCNMFAVAKTWHIFQAICMLRRSLKKLHGVFAVFLWGSSWERMSRTNLFRSVKSGGLGLAHLFIRQIVSRVMFPKEQRDFFQRTVVQVRLRNVIPDYVVSNSVI